MAAIQFSTDLNELGGENNAVFTIGKPEGRGYGVAAVTGIIGAAAAAGASFFVMRLDLGATVQAHIKRIRLQFTTIAAFTVPVTAGRRLGLFRGSGANAAGGTAITMANAQKSTAYADSEFAVAQGGDARVSTTAGLTVTGITFEVDPFRLMSLSHVGAAGSFDDAIFEFEGSESLVLQPGQLIAIRNPVAMDAGGTWQLTVAVEWQEVG